MIQAVHQDWAGAPAASTPPPDHTEWLIDESLEETFPASDPTTPVRPGSIAGRYVTEHRARDRPAHASRMSTRSWMPWLALAGSAIWLALWRRKR